MARPGQTLRDVAARARRRPVRTAALSAGAAGVAGAAYWPRGTKGEPGGEEGPMANVFVEPAGN